MTLILRFLYGCKTTEIDQSTMETCLLLPILILSLITFISGAESTSFILQNNCPYTIWPAAQSNANSPPLGTTGFILGSGWSYTVDAPPSWQGRFWARTLCANSSSGGFVCATGDCSSSQVSCNGNSVTLTEFALNGFSSNDFYDVSLVDGFNVPVTITPQSGSCKSAGCPNDVNSVCPWQMAIKDANGSSVIACKSACSVFNTDAYCCRGSFNTPQTCTLSNFAKVFKSQCPQAYTYAFDQDTNTFTCPTGGDYFITFCPSSGQPQYLGMHCIP